HTRDLQLSNGATISAQSIGTGNAGDIRITGAETILLRGNSAVTTEATQASGGNIEVNAQSLVRLRDSRLTASVFGGPDTVGGKVTIDPEFIILENSQITARAIEGQGGKIQLTTGVFLANPLSSVNASSDIGIDGQVDIRAPVSNLSGLVTPLSPGYAGAIKL